MALLRFLLIFFIVSYILYLLGKWWLKWKIKKFNKDFNERFSDTNGKRKEGDVHVKYNPGNNKIINDDQGDYIDYEEIDN